MKSVEVVEANFLSQLSAAAAEMVMYTYRQGRMLGRAEALWDKRRSFRVGRAEKLGTKGWSWESRDIRDKR